WVLARDEALHSRFGWVFLDWAREQAAFKGHLSQALGLRARGEVGRLREGWAQLRKRPEEMHSPLSPFGGLDSEAYLLRGEEALQRLVLAPRAARGIAVETAS